MLKSAPTASADLDVAEAISGTRRRVRLTNGDNRGVTEIDMTESDPGDAAARLDSVLLTRIATGDGEAFRALYDRYGRMVHSVAFRILQDPQLSEECVQDVFVELWRSANRFDPARARPSTWLYAIARNRAIDALRRRARRPVPQADVEPAGSSPDTVDLVSAADEAIRVAEAMATLQPAQLEVVQLVYFDGLSHTEVAGKLGLPLGTVKSRLRLAVDRLRKLVEDLELEVAR
jgi:RNA polymerase sigma-70 factor (ECF subfamily)